jgi:hypothetical protein
MASGHEMAVRMEALGLALVLKRQPLLEPRQVELELELVVGSG